VELSLKNRIRFTDLFPEDSTSICLFWQVFWLTSLFAAFPSVNRQTVAEITKSFYKGLQLRVQLRFRTGFPFQTLPRSGELVTNTGQK
jgi:hypothetical protein